jgi:hypothetical protein
MVRQKKSQSPLPEGAPLPYQPPQPSEVPPENPPSPPPDGATLLSDAEPPAAPEKRGRGRPPGTRNAPKGDDALKAEDLGGLHELVGDALSFLPGYEGIEPAAFARLNRLGLPVWREWVKSGQTMSRFLYGLEAARVYALRLARAVWSWFQAAPKQLPRGDSGGPHGRNSVPASEGESESSAVRAAPPVSLVPPEEDRRPTARDLGAR